MKRKIRAFGLSFFSSMLVLVLLTGLLTAGWRTYQVGFSTDTAPAAPGEGGGPAGFWKGEKANRRAPTGEDLGERYEQWGWLLPAGPRLLWEGGKLLMEGLAGKAEE
ncbi:MAG: hypothetical protein MR014_02660 [Oscillospiraceae bacterium]|nr:hypothetical protein [Oscillospiraceae bacterium]